MVTLEQIRQLEAKIQRAVAYIAELKEENLVLSTKLKKCQDRINEFEVLLRDYKENQKEIEQGILNALFHLDQLEDGFAKAPADADKPKEPVAAPKTEEPEEIDDVEGKAFDEADPEDETAQEANPPKKTGELDIF